MSLAIATEPDDSEGRMTWRYAVTRNKFPRGGEIYFNIREVYCRGDEVDMWSAEAMSPWGETLAELRKDLLSMQKALDGPVLDLTVDPPQWIARERRGFAD